MVFGIGDVCRLLGVKPHVLRYWEEALPFLSDNGGGRRRYSRSDLQFLARMKHLITVRRFTREGACLRLLEERQAGTGELWDLRSTLLGLKAVNARDRAARNAELRRLLGCLEFVSPGFARSAGARELHGVLHSLALIHPASLRWIKETAGRSAARPAALRRALAAGPGDEAAGVSLVRRGSLAVVTALPPIPMSSSQVTAGLSGLSAAVRAMSDERSRAPRWWILYDEELHGRAAVWRARRISTLRVPPLPCPGPDGIVHPARNGRIDLRRSARLGLGILLSSAALRAHLEAQGISHVLVLPLNRYARAFPHLPFLGAASRSGVAAAALAFRQEGTCRTSGVYCLSSSVIGEGFPARLRRLDREAENDDTHAEEQRWRIDMSLLDSCLEFADAFRVYCD